MKNYETSEQLFIDIWEKYGSPSEIDDAETIYSFFTELVEIFIYIVFVKSLCQQQMMFTTFIKQ